MRPDQIFAWIATLFCVGISARTATTFLRRSPRLFTVMALFACVWALLLPFYSNVHSELLPAYGGFLLVYIGGLITLEANSREGSNGDSEVVLLQRLGLWLFLFIATPSAIGIALPNGAGIRLSRLQTELLVGTLINVTGYAAVAYGGHVFFRRTVSVVLAVFLSIYGVLEVVYTVVMWPPFAATETASMPPSLNCLFATAKLVFTVLFSGAVAYEGMSAEDKDGGLFHCILRHVGLK